MHLQNIVILYTSKFSITTILGLIQTVPTWAIPDALYPFQLFYHINHYCLSPLQPVILFPSPANHFTFLPTYYISLNQSLSACRLVPGDDPLQVLTGWLTPALKAGITKLLNTLPCPTRKNHLAPSRWPSLSTFHFKLLSRFTVP